MAPIQSSVRIRHLKYIHEAPKQLDKKTERSLINQEMERLKLSLAEDFTAKLSSSGIFVPASLLDADVEIRVNLEAYGRVPGKWLVLLVGSGIAEALVQGVIVEKVTGNKWLALGVGAEEVASESLTWLGGAFLTNRFLTPIMLSCHVLRFHDHKTIWSKYIVSLFSRKIIAHLPSERRNRREDQLAALTDHALDELEHALIKARPKIYKRAIIGQ